jgi:hypothetical protein
MSGLVVSVEVGLLTHRALESLDVLGQVGPAPVEAAINRGLVAAGRLQLGSGDGRDGRRQARRVLRHTGPARGAGWWNCRRS